MGTFDPDMHYSEDNEFNLRIILNGGQIFLSPQIKSFYFPRESLKELEAKLGSVLKNEFFSHFGVQNMLKIHAKILLGPLLREFFIRLDEEGI